MSAAVDVGRIAIDVALGWRSGRVASDPSILRRAVSHAVGDDVASADPGAQAVLASVLRCIAAELESMFSAPVPGTGPSRDGRLPADRVRACCAALAAGLPADATAGRSRPAIRADLQRLMVRLARHEAPRSEFGRRLLELDAAVRAGITVRAPARHGRPTVDDATTFDLRSFRRHRFGRHA